MNTPIRPLIALAALMLSSGCDVLTEEPLVTPVTSEDDALELAGQGYLLEDAEGYTLAEDTTFFLNFSSDYISAWAGCNSMEGGYTIEDDTLAVFEMSTTDMWCSDEMNAQESWLAGFLSSAPSVALSDGRLVLETDDATLTFLDEDIATPDLPLTEGDWTVDSLIESDSISTSNLAEFPTIWFDEEGVFGVSSSCTEVSGSYVADGEALTLSDVQVTTLACNDASAEVFDDGILVVIREGTLTHSISGSRLSILDGDRGISAFID